MSLRQANNSTRLASLSVLALILGAAPAGAQRADDMTIVHDHCIAFVHQHPKEGLEKAKQWREQGGGFLADHCIATALFDLKDYAGAGKRFEALATAMMGMPAVQRAATLDQAGQAWLSADDFAHAKADFDAAIAFNGEAPELLVDRASAYAGMKQYWEAIDDLNRAIDLAPRSAEAYIFRASAYRSVEELDLALEDAERGLALAPDNVLGLLERGNVRRLKGDVAGARADWLRVTQLGANTPAGKAAQANLAKLGRKEGAAKGPAPAKPKSP
jgi:tetratricopeptide (TPR) repeat protein